MKIVTVSSSDRQLSESIDEVSSCIVDNSLPNITCSSLYFKSLRRHLQDKGCGWDVSIVGVKRLKHSVLPMSVNKPLYADTGFGGLPSVLARMFSLCLKNDAVIIEFAISGPYLLLLCTEFNCRWSLSFLFVPLPTFM